MDGVLNMCEGCDVMCKASDVMCNVGEVGVKVLRFKCEVAMFGPKSVESNC